MTEDDNGPSPEEQAMVDAEQRVLVDRIRKERARQEAIEANEQRKLARERMAAEQAQRLREEKRWSDLVDRVKALEKLAGIVR